MKLYAKTTSERASKGQGGTELIITISDEKQRDIASIYVLPRRGKDIFDNKVAMFVRYLCEQTTVLTEDIDQVSQLHYPSVYIEKGKQKKDESCAVGWCAKHQTRHTV